MANKDPNPFENIPQIEAALFLLASNTNAAMMLYRDGKVSLLNPAAEQITGYNSEEMIGSDALMVLLSQEGNEIYRESLTNQGKSSLQFETTIITKSGNPRWVDVNISKIGDSEPQIKLITMMDKIPDNGIGRMPDLENNGYREIFQSNLNNKSGSNCINTEIDPQTNYTNEISHDPHEPLSAAYQRLEQLRAISDDIASSSTLEARMEAIAQGVVEQLGFDIAIVSILDKTKQTLSQAAIYPMGARIRLILNSIGWDLNNIKLPYNTGVNPIRDQLRAGVPYLGHSLADLLCPPLPRRVIDLAVRIYGIQTILDIPLTVDSEVVGFLLILSRQKTISQGDMHASDLVASQAATAIERARHLQRLQQRSEDLAESIERLESVRAIGDEVSRAPNIDEKLIAVVKGLVEQLGFDVAHIRLHDQSTSISTRAAIYPFSGKVKKTLNQLGLDICSNKYQYEAGTNPTLDKLLAGEPHLGGNFTEIISPPIPKEIAAIIQRLYNIRSIYAVPLSVDDKTVGWLGVTTNADEITIEDQHAVELISCQAASAIETASTLEDLKQRSQELEDALSELEITQASLEKRVEERTLEIQTQKQFFEALVLNSPIAVVMLDLEHNIVACNPAFEALFGYNQEEVLGQYVDDLVAPPGGYDEATDYTRQVLKGKTIRSTRKRRTKNGELVDVELFGVPVMVNDQQIGVLGLYNNISERVKAETALRESEERLDLALSSAGLGMWDKDFCTGKTVYNQMWAEMLGYSLDDFEPNVDLLYELIHPDDYLNTMDAMNAHLKDQTPMFEIIHRMKTKSGNWKWLLNTGKVVERDKNNNPLRAVGVQMDITERIQAEQALQKSEERYHVLFESAPDAYYLSDLTGKFVDGNRFAENLTGYQREELIGKSFMELDLLPKPQLPKAAKLLAMNVLGKPTGPDKFTLKRKDRKHLDIAIRTFPVEIDGQSLVLGIARDVTERTRIEAQQHKVNRELTLINELSREISARLEPEQVYNAIHRAASQLMPADVFVIAMLNEHDQKIDLVYISELGTRIPSVQIGITEGLSGYVISSGQALITGNFDQTHTENVKSISVGDSDTETQSVLAVPMKRGDKTIGMLSAQCFETNAFDEHDQQLLEMLTSHAQLALENANLFAEVQRLAITDGLTGLHNRFYFDQQLSLEFDRARRYERSLGMVLIDPDNFKQVNDQFGHPAGDVVLMMFAELIKNGARKSDIVARYGGDEFVILLPETDLPGTISLAEKIRDAVYTHTFRFQDHNIRFTTSIGVAATSGQDISDPDILTKQADKALYQAKRRGRNQVCCNSND